jgi:hypothetical protein
MYDDPIYARVINLILIFFLLICFRTNARHGVWGALRLSHNTSRSSTGLILFLLFFNSFVHAPLPLTLVSPRHHHHTATCQSGYLENTTQSACIEMSACTAKYALETIDPLKTEFPTSLVPGRVAGTNSLEIVVQHPAVKGRVVKSIVLNATNAACNYPGRELVSRRRCADGDVGGDGDVSRRVHVVDSVADCGVAVRHGAERECDARVVRRRRRGELRRPAAGARRRAARAAPGAQHRAVPTRAAESDRRHHDERDDVRRAASLERHHAPAVRLSAAQCDAGARAVAGGAAAHAVAGVGDAAERHHDRAVGRAQQCAVRRRVQCDLSADVHVWRRSGRAVSARRRLCVYVHGRLSSVGRQHAAVSDGDDDAAAVDQRDARQRGHLRSRAAAAAGRRQADVARHVRSADVCVRAREDGVLPGAERALSVHRRLAQRLSVRVEPTADGGARGQERPASDGLQRRRRRRRRRLELCVRRQRDAWRADAPPSLCLSAVDRRIRRRAA